MTPTPIALAPSRRRAWLERARRWTHLITDWFPLTVLGLLAVPLLLWVMSAFGFERKDMVLLALTVGGLVLLAVAVIQVVVTALWLRVRREASSAGALVLDTGFPFQTGYKLGPVSWNPLVRVELTWEQPAGVRVQLAPTWAGPAEEVVADERGRTTEIVRRFTVSDVLGLARVSFTRRQQRSIEIRPACGRVPALRLPPQLIAGDEIEHPEGRPEGDLIEMRAYANGDPLRLVLWKAYARTGQMLVRVPERAVARSQKVLAYFVAGAGDEASAGVARTALEAGLFGDDFVFAADGDTMPSTMADESIARLVGSVQARAHGGEGLDAFLSEGAGQGLNACVLLVPARPGAWLASVSAALSHHAGPFRIVIGVDELAPAPSPGWLTRLLLRQPAPAGSTTADVREVVERLQAVAPDVYVLRRSTGETVDPMA